MNMKRIIGAGLALSLVASIGLVLGAPRAAHAGHGGSSSFGGTQTVNCGGFFNTSINKVIERSDRSRHLTINVKGNCIENVRIERDWVTLQPSKFSGGSIETADDTEPTILITGRHVTVQDFDGASISGGVTVRSGGSASILNNHITGATSASIPVGLFISEASFALIEGNLIDYNTWGVIINGSSNGRFESNQILFSDEIGVVVSEGASARFEAGNTVANSGQNATISPGSGLLVFRVGSVRIIDGNGGEPISDGVIVIRGELIEAVGPSAATVRPENARLIDAQGLTALPCLPPATTASIFTERDTFSVRYVTAL